MKTVNLLFSVVCILALASCIQRQKDDATFIYVDNEKPQEVSLCDTVFRCVNLDQAIELLSISQIDFLETGELLIAGSNRLYLISPETGKELKQLSRRGRANNEYTSLHSFYQDNAKIVINDFDGNKVLMVDPLTDVITSASKPSSGNFSFLCRLDMDTFVGKRTYGVGSIPVLSLYNNDLELISPKGKDLLKSGISTGYPFAKGENGVLFNRSLTYDIQEVTRDTTKTKYHIRFKSHNLPSLDHYDDDFDLIREISETSMPVISRISHVYEDDTKLCFDYTDSVDGVMYAIFDRYTDQTQSLRFIPEDKSSTIIAIVNHMGEVYIFSQDIDGKYCYYIISHNNLKTL